MFQSVWMNTAFYQCAICYNINTLQNVCLLCSCGSIMDKDTRLIAIYLFKMYVTFNVQNLLSTQFSNPVSDWLLALQLWFTFGLFYLVFPFRLLQQHCTNLNHLMLLPQVGLLNCLMFQHCKLILKINNHK